jgi:hypothetical protein
MAAGHLLIPSADLAWLRGLPEELLLNRWRMGVPRYARKPVELDLASLTHL